ncbi:MAG: TatD family hydrolase [Thermincola sp.]|nr:TatD family hydrolase [Thermincola sp.]MDT3702075.1 TatD family hydrolase [Thermincola sp.]
MKLLFIDSHAHLDDLKYDSDRDEMLQRARNNKISKIINVGYDLPSSRRSLELAAKYDFIYAAVGIHPHDAAEAGENYLAEIRIMASRPKVVAIGEMGLDYYRNLSPKETQQRVFREQIRLAAELEKPIIIHDREAHGDVMTILRDEGIGPAKGVLHCFSGSMEMARECLKMGFYLSIAGPVTFSNANKLRDVAANVPIDRLLIETDAPYLTPEPHRGKRNESAYVAYVGQRIAEIRGIPVAELAAAATANAKRLFRIS